MDMLDVPRTVGAAMQQERLTVTSAELLSSLLPPTGCGRASGGPTCVITPKLCFIHGINPHLLLLFPQLADTASIPKIQRAV